MISDAPLEISPLGPASCGSYVWRQGSTLWATVVVKVTFQLVHGEIARAIAPLAVVTRDRLRDTGSLEAASELAPYLPSVGVILCGHAYAPSGRPSTSAAVRLGILGARPWIDKTLHVFGDRRSSSAAAPEPFEKMPLVYERAYGGPDVAENPVGVGAVAGPLPNILDPVDPRRPAGFGPIARRWPARRRMLGSFDADTLDQPAPEIPSTFNWRYFHAAPADQQFGALQGEEWIVLDGMHPTSPRIQTRLPGVVARAEWQPRTAAGPGPARSLDLRADSLVIDADGLVCSVLWRGRLRLPHPDAVHDLRVLAGVELPGRPMPGPTRESASGGPSESIVQATARAGASTLAETTGVDLSAVLATVLPFSPEGASPGLETDTGRPTLPLAPTHSAVAEASAPPRADALSGTTVLDLRRMQAPSTPFERDAAMPVGLVSAPMVESPLAGTLGPSGAMSLRPSLPFVPADPSRPPEASVSNSPSSGYENPLSGTAELNLQAILRSIVPFAGTNATGGSAPRSTTASQEEPPRLVNPPPSEPAPSANIETGKSAEDAPPASLPSVPPEPAPPAASPAPGSASAQPYENVRALVVELLSAGRPLHILDLSGADLHGLDLNGAMLSGMDLRRTNLRGSSFVGARLTGVHFEGADLTDAVLIRANLSHAHLSHAVLVRADLRGARVADANLTGADLREAKLDGVDLSRAKLGGARLPEGIAIAERANEATRARS